MCLFDCLNFLFSQNSLDLTEYDSLGPKQPPAHWLLHDTHRPAALLANLSEGHADTHTPLSSTKRQVVHCDEEVKINKKISREIVRETE